MAKSKCLAIVFGRNYTSRLTMIRAIGIAGCDVVDVQLFHSKKSIRKELIDSSSKYVVKTFTIYENDFDEYYKIIEQYRDYSGTVILLPTDDHSAAALDFNYDKLKNRFVLPNVQNKQGELVKLMNKGVQKSVAESHGFNVPKGWTAIYKDSKFIIPEGVTYPCFIKPEESFKNALKVYMKRCDNRKDLEIALSNISKVSTDAILIEQYINIEKEYAILGLSYQGEVSIPAIIQMKKEYLGVTAVGTISPITEIPQLYEKLKKLMQDVQFNGLFDVDMYESEGKLFFNELNCRFGASGFAVISSVSNLPELFMKLSLNEKISIGNEKFYQSQSFASEKVCKQMLLNRIITLFEYKRIMKEVDFSFLKQDYDIEPYNVFMKTFYKEWFKSRIKWIVKRWLKK